MPGALPGASELSGEKEEDIKMNTRSQTAAAGSSPETPEGMATVYPQTVVAAGTRMLEAGLPAATSLAVERWMSGDPAYGFCSSLKKRSLDFLRAISEDNLKSNRSKGWRSQEGQPPASHPKALSVPASLGPCFTAGRTAARLLLVT